MLLQDPSGALFRVLQMSQTVIGQEPSRLAVVTRAILHEQCRAVMQDRDVRDKGVLSAFQDRIPTDANVVKRLLIQQPRKVGRMTRQSKIEGPHVIVRRARRTDAKYILRLIVGLADFERLEPPDNKAKTRLVRDIFERKIVNVFVAEVGKELVGYALYFYTYSSFLASRALFLEDIFVRKENRRDGVGAALLLRCVNEARSRGCRRMQWEVLTWNVKAMRFYERFGAKKLEDLVLFRLDDKTLLRLSQ